MDEAKGRGLHRLSQILSMLIRTVRPWFPGWRRQRRYSVTSGWRVRRRWARGARRAGAGCGWRRGVFGSWHGRFVGIHCRAAVFLAELFRLPETSQDVRVGTTGSGEFRPRPPTCHGPCPASARLEAMTLGHRAGHGWSQTFLNTRFGERIEAADGGSAHTTRTGPPPDKARGGLDHLHPGFVRNWAADHLVIGAPGCGSWATARPDDTGTCILHGDKAALTSPRERAKYTARSALIGVLTRTSKPNDTSFAPLRSAARLPRLRPERAAHPSRSPAAPPGPGHRSTGTAS